MSQIAAASSQCLSSFDVLCSELNGPKSMHRQLQNISLNGARCEQGRFRAWCENLGALEHGRCSLDSRLRESAEVLASVTKLLHELQTALFESIAIVSGCQPSTDQQAGQNNIDEDEQSADETHDAVEHQPSKKLYMRQTSIVEIITDLHAIGSQIRNSNTQSEPLKPTIHKEVDPTTSIEIYSRYSEYDKQHVSELLRELRKGRLDPEGTYDYIIPRFAAALTLRRKQFKSWERHSKEPAPKAVSWSSESKNGFGCVISMAEARNGDSKASAVGLTCWGQPRETGISNSNAFLNETGGGLESNHVLFPPPPAETAEWKEFTCPYCWEVCPVESGQPQLWRAHVIRDLQPYVCTYEQCPHPYQLYGSRKQWIDHEDTFHRRLWRCRKHRTSIHSTMRGLNNHFCQTHACSLDEGRLLGLIDTSLSSFVNDRSICPICLSSGPFYDGLDHHLADHLERIATFALPQNVNAAGNLPEDSATKSIKSLEIDVYTSTSRDTDFPGDGCPEPVEIESRDDFAQRLHNHHNDQQSNCLISAVYAGNNAQVDALLQQGANPDAMDGDDKTALAYAAEKGFQTIARMLHDHGADPNFQSLFQGTPLRFAVAAKQHDIVNMMFDHGATPTPMNSFQDTTLMHAAAKGDEAMVRILADRGVDPDARNMYGESALSLAAETNHFTIVKYLLDSGVEVDPKHFEMRTPLSLASANGHKEIVKILLDHGSDPNYTDARGMSPLSWAAENGHAVIVSMMLECGASFHLTALRISAFKQDDILKLLMEQNVNPNLVDYRGRTPLLIAATEGHETMTRTLLNNDADPNTIDPDQRTPLLAAISDGNSTIVSMLLSKGADPNYQDPTGRTPLSWAAETGHLEIVRALLSAGSSPHTPDTVSGQTPLHRASSKGHASVVQLLLSCGADHKSTCRAGQTAVLKAAKMGSFLTVAVLLCSGADPNVCDERGRAPLFYAVRSGDRWMMEVLRWKSASKRERVPATISCFDRLTR